MGNLENGIMTWMYGRTIITCNDDGFTCGGVLNFQSEISGAIFGGQVKTLMGHVSPDTWRLQGLALHQSATMQLPYPLQLLQYGVRTTKASRMAGRCGNLLGVMIATSTQRQSSGCNLELRLPPATQMSYEANARLF